VFGKDFEGINFSATLLLLFSGTAVASACVKDKGSCFRLLLFFDSLAGVSIESSKKEFFSATHSLKSARRSG
jgi:hypothetical protein